MGVPLVHDGSEHLVLVLALSLWAPVTHDRFDLLRVETVVLEGALEHRLEHAGLHGSEGIAPLAGPVARECVEGPLRSLLCFRHHLLSGVEARRVDEYALVHHAPERVEACLRLPSTHPRPNVIGRDRRRSTVRAAQIRPIWSVVSELAGLLLALVHRPSHADVVVKFDEALRNVVKGDEPFQKNGLHRFDRNGL